MAGRRDQPKKKPIKVGIGQGFGGGNKAKEKGSPGIQSSLFQGLMGNVVLMPIGYSILGAEVGLIPGHG